VRSHFAAAEREGKGEKKKRGRKGMGEDTSR